VTSAVWTAAVILFFTMSACSGLPPATQVTEPPATPKPTQTAPLTTVPPDHEDEMLKLEPRLQKQIQADPRQPVKVIVQFFEKPSPAEQQQLEALMEVSAYSFGPVNFVEGTAVAQQLEEISSLPFVKWVEPQAESDVSAGD
jgi:hypothetical protein